MSRPPTYHTAEEKPVSVSLRLPRALYDHAQQYISQRRISLTELLLDGLRLALETPADPRDILVLHDNTVMQELQTMVDARIEAALARERTLAPPRDTPTRAPALPASIPELSNDDNNTVIQEKDAAPPDAPDALETQIDEHITRLEHRIHEIQHDDNTTVIQEPLVEAAVTPQDNIRHYDNTVLQEGTAQVSDTEGTSGQTAVPPFDARTRYLGPLCPQGHDWAGTGQSLRNTKSNNCLACNKESQRAKRRQAAASQWPTGPEFL